MKQKPLIVAIIPARGGSKRIPQKNIRLFCGKHIIAYSIEAAQNSKIFDKVIVSTDSNEIAKIAVSLGAEVPFLRPQELSGDYVGIREVIAHAVKWMWEKGWRLNAVCCIYATAPLLRHDDLIEAYKIFQKDKWDYILAATEYIYPIQRSFRIQKSGSVEMFFPENFSKRSQDLEKAYHDAGQFCWGKPEAWIENMMLFSVRSSILKIPAYRVVDIDTEEDWKRAEIIYNVLKKEDSKK